MKPNYDAGLMDRQMRSGRSRVGLAAGMALAFIGATGLIFPPAAECRPLNIILIMADDLGPEMLGCYGAEDVQTPHIDRLAREGTFFKTCWATPVCGPSRALIMTGRYGFRTGEWNMGDRPGGPKWARPELNFCKDQPTFGKMLRRAGYATALAGKWQLSAPSFENITGAGFDEYCIWSIPFHEGYGSRGVRNKEGAKSSGGSRYWHPSIEQNGKMIRTTEADYGPDLYCDFLINFMRKNKEKPFLLYYPMCLPHEPIGATPVWDGEINSDVHTIRRNVEYIDVLVGRLAAAVEEEGLDGRTVFIFCGDNGTETNGKNTPTDMACRVPMILRGPGIKAQGQVEALMDLSDIMPTLAAFAETSLPSGFSYDGHDMTPVLSGESDGMREWIFSYMGPFRMVRSRDWILECESVDHPGVLHYSEGPGRYEDRSLHPESDSVRRRLIEIMDDKPAPVINRVERALFTEYMFGYHHGDNIEALPVSSRNCLEELRKTLSTDHWKPPRN